MIKTNQGYLITQERLSSASQGKQSRDRACKERREGGGEQLAKPLPSEIDRAGEGGKRRSLLATPAKESAASQPGGLQTMGPEEHSKNAPR